MNSAPIKPSSSPKPSFARLMGISPYLPGVLQTIVLLMAGAVLAGAHDLGPKLEPLLLDPKFSALALAVFGLHFFLIMVRGTFATARAGENLGSEWSSMWVPVKLAITAGLLLPVSGGASTVMHSLAWAVRWGAGL